MDLGIAHRRAAVAAGSAGLGLATARALAAEGVSVAICGRDPDRLAAAAASIGAVGIVCDVSDPGAAANWIEQAAASLGGPVDIVVANAGGPPPGTASRTDLDSYRQALDLNCLATIAMCTAAVGPMRSQGWGRLLAITSIGARQPIPYLAASTVARAATTAFMKTLATEVAGDGVTVNTIQPGSHDTDRIRSLAGEQANSLLAEIPAGHLGDADDFGSVAAFLCSMQAGFITGASLIVDGGASRGLQ